MHARSNGVVTKSESTTSPANPDAARSGASYSRLADRGSLRMLENVLEVGERPDDLIVYAAFGKAARDWASFHRIVAALKTLPDDRTLLIQSGKPIAVFPTHSDAPRVLMANSNLVGRLATAEHF